MQEIIARIQNNPNPEIYEEIDLSHSSFTDDEIDLFLNAIKDKKVFEVRFGDVHGEKMNKIADYIRSGGVIYSLIFERNSLDNNDIKILVEALKDNTNITYLELPYNCRKIDVSQYNEQSIQLIAELLQNNNRTLVSVFMTFDVKLNLETANAINKAARSNKALMHFVPGGRFFNTSEVEDVMGEVEEALESNRTNFSNLCSRFLNNEINKSDTPILKEYKSAIDNISWVIRKRGCSLLEYFFSGGDTGKNWFLPEIGLRIIRDSISWTNMLRSSFFLEITLPNSQTVEQFLKGLDTKTVEKNNAGAQETVITIQSGKLNSPQVIGSKEKILEV